jgi:hypothetical protein
VTSVVETGSTRSVAAPVAPPTDQRRALLLVAGLAALLPLLLLRSAVHDTAMLHPLSGPDAAWWPVGARRAALLEAPLAVAGALALLWAPGLLLALLLDRARTVEEWVLHAFPLSLVAVSAAAAAAQAVLGAPLTGGRFVAVAAACAALAAGGLVLRIRLGRPPQWPLAAPHAAATLAGFALLPLALLAGLAPKFLWEAFNGDGAHAYESARLLLHQALPFFPAGSGEIAGFPDSKSFLFAYPASWFIRLFGPLEVSARLPLLLYMPPLAAGIFALAAHGRVRVLGGAERWLVGLALTSYVLVVAFATTYSPYSADIALPATQDTLLVVAFLGFVLALLQQRWGWAALWAFLTHTSLPNGLLLMGFWLVARWVLDRRLHGREVAAGAGVVVLAVLAVGLIGPLLKAAGASAPGGEYGAAGLLLRFAFLQVTDIGRFAYVIVPCGILPALALLRWGRQDGVGRAFTLVTAGYFMFAFIQAYAPLHYYIPAMLLPLIVHWRMEPKPAHRPRLLMATAVAGVAALLLAWPAEPGPFTASRAVGASIDLRVPGYERLEPDPLRASTLLHHLVPYDWDARVPDTSFGGSPLVFQYYAHSAPPGTPRNYILQRTQDAAPTAAEQIASSDGYAIWVRDAAIWEKHLALRPTAAPGALLFRQSRSTLFRSVRGPDGPRVIDLPAVAARLGFDVDAVARRFGIDP